MGQGPSHNVIRADIIQKPLPEFTRYNDYIKEKIIKHNVSNNNINGLKCRTNKDTITYGEDSDFNKLENIIKSYYRNLVSGHDISFTKVFKNNEADSGLFLEYSLVFDTYIYTKFIEKLQSEKIKINDKDINIEDNINLSKLLFEKKLDDFIDPKPPYMPEQYEEPLLINYKEIMNVVNTGKSVCLISYVKNNFKFHAIAIIFWKDDTGQINCGLYDPIYFERTNGNYVWAVNTLYIKLKVLSKKYALTLKKNTNHTLNIINLSLFCLRNEKGIHCSQYIINAEYCSMYCMYFLFLYGQQNFPKDLNSIKEIITNTFIVGPEKLIRKPCRDTNIFRIVMFNFILSILIIITEDLKILRQINDINLEYYNKYNYNLITDDLLEYLQTPIKKQNLINNEQREERRKKRLLHVQKVNTHIDTHIDTNLVHINTEGHSMSAGRYNKNKSKTKYKLKNKYKLKTKYKLNTKYKLKNKSKTQITKI